jgi:hypothetical protein
LQLLMKTWVLIRGVIFLWCRHTCFRNMEWLKRTATTGALWPTKSNEASHSPLSNTGAVWLGFWNPCVVAMKWPHGDHPSRLKNVDPTCNSSSKSLIKSAGQWSFYIATIATYRHQLKQILTYWGLILCTSWSLCLVTDQISLIHEVDQAIHEHT